MSERSAPGDGLRNRLKEVRQRLGKSQQELARAAGVARQTIGGIEAGTYSVSMAVALKVARALDCPVEEIFWLEGVAQTVRAEPAGGAALSGRVCLARVGGRWVAHSLQGEAAFRQELAPADGVAEPEGRVRLLDDPEALERTVLVAGCAPALSLWARSAERWHPGLRVQALHANSAQALAMVARREVHAAGIHFHEDNVSAARAALGEGAVLVEIGVWEEGLAVAAGNPKAVRAVDDLARPGIRLVNREGGAGCRLLLDAALAQRSIPPDALAGYADEVDSHLAVARAVREARADAGVTVRAVAEAMGLDFVALEAVRYELALRRETMESDAVQAALETLRHRWVLRQLAESAGYEIGGTGRRR